MAIYNVFKDKKFEKLLNQFDNSILKVPTSSTIDISDNLVGQAIKQSILSNDDSLTVDSLFSNISVSTERLARYGTYDELFSAVQLIKRIIVIYLNNLLQRDTITNKILNVTSTEESSDIGTYVEYQTFCESFIKFFDLENKFRTHTASQVLKYGDSFIELINLDIVDVSIPRSVPKKKIKSVSITEDEFLNKLNSKNSYNSFSVTDIIGVLDNFVEFDDEPHVTSLTITERDNELESNINVFKTPYSFGKLLLKFHRPHNIIPIVTEYNTTLGYVEVAEVAKSNTSGSNNNLVNFANIINQISASSYVGGETKSEKEENVLKLFVDSLILKILKQYDIVDNGKTDSEYSNELKTKLKNDLFYVVKRLAISSKTNSLFKNKLKIRFIPVQDMFHFSNPGTGSFVPYGDSVIDQLIFPGKLYLLTQLANAVTRLSRSSIMRKWTIETGARDDVNSLLQKLKKNLKNQRVTGEDIATSKNLPNILSDFKDMVAFKKKGQTFVDLDILNSGDPNVNIRDLEDLRRELISLSGVPSSYLGYQDVVELKDQLVNVNIVFANDISAIQKNFNDNLTSLVARASEIVKFKKYSEVKSNVHIGLIPPTVLVLQNIEASINSISTIQRIFAEIPEIDVDPMFLLRRYCPMINWDEFEREAGDFKQRKKVSSTTGDTTATGGTY